jgi:hypothetical protein
VTHWTGSGSHIASSPRSGHARSKWSGVGRYGGAGRNSSGTTAPCALSRRSDDRRARSPRRNAQSTARQRGGQSGRRGGRKRRGDSRVRSAARRRAGASGQGDRRFREPGAAARGHGGGQAALVAPAALESLKVKAFRSRLLADVPISDDGLTCQQRETVRQEPSPSAPEAHRRPLTAFPRLAPQPKSPPRAACGHPRAARP